MKFLESQEPTKRRKPVMKIKKLFTLALTAALTISLAACSGGASATKMTMGTYCIRLYNGFCQDD